MITPEDRVAFAEEALAAFDCPAELRSIESDFADFLAWARSLPVDRSECDDMLPRAALAARLVLITEHLAAQPGADREDFEQAGRAWARLEWMRDLAMALRIRRGGRKNRISRADIHKAYVATKTPEMTKAEARKLVAEDLGISLRSVADATRDRGRPGKPRT